MMPKVSTWVGSSALMVGWRWSPGVLAGSAVRSPKDSGMAGARVVVASRKPEACAETEEALRSVGIDATGIACHMGSLE